MAVRPFESADNGGSGARGAGPVPSAPVAVCPHVMDMRRGVVLWALGNTRLKTASFIRSDFALIEGVAKREAAAVVADVVCGRDRLRAWYC